MIRMNGYFVIGLNNLDNLVVDIVENTYDKNIDGTVDLMDQ